MSEERTIGDYHLGPEMGTWGDQVVFRATHATSGNKVALVTARQERCSSPQQLTRFATHLRHIAKLQHSRLVQAKSLFDSSEGVPCLVVERPRGKTLAQLTSTGGLATDLACEIALQLLAGVAAAHEMGIVHGHLSSENVYVDIPRQDEPNVTIIGIGCARPGAPDGQTFSDDATLVAPEVRAGQPFSVAGDVFLVGAILFEMLTGVPAPSVAGQTLDISSLLTKKNAQVPEPLARAIQWSLDPCAGDRLAHPQEFARQLVPYLKPRAGNKAQWLRSLDPMLSFSRRVEPEEQGASLRLARAPRPHQDPACPEAMLLDPAFPKAPLAPSLDALNADVFGPRTVPAEPAPAPTPEVETYATDGENRTAALAMGTGAGLGAVLAWLSAII